MSIRICNLWHDWDRYSMPESDILLQWFKRNSYNLSQPSDICKRTHNLLKLYTGSCLRSVYTKRQHQRCDGASDTFSVIVMFNFNVDTNDTTTSVLNLFHILQNSHSNQSNCKKLHLQKNDLSHRFQCIITQ